MGDTAHSLLELGLHGNAQQVTLNTTGRLDAVLHEPYSQRTQHTIGVLASSVSASLLWNRSYRTRKRSSRSSLWTGIAKERELWRSVLGQRCGIALDTNPCPYAGFWRVTPWASVLAICHLFHRSHLVDSTNRQSFYEALESRGDL
jgi:hypothetical protein